MTEITITMEKPDLVKAKKDYAERFSGMDKIEHCWFYDDKNIAEFSIDEIQEDGTILLSAATRDGNYISIGFKLSDDDLIDVMGMVVKRINKFKTVLEGLSD